MIEYSKRWVMAHKKEQPRELTKEEKVAEILKRANVSYDFKKRRQTLRSTPAANAAARLCRALKGLFLKTNAATAWWKKAENPAINSSGNT